MNIAEQLTPLPLIKPDTSPVDIFRVGHNLVAGPITLASSFGIEDVVLIDLLKDHLDKLTVFAIDTGRLNEETYEVAESLVTKYGIKIDWFFPKFEAVEGLEREKGLFSFRDSVKNRQECCFIRKVEPLQRALKRYSGWVTGMRREQSVTRTGLEAIEIDGVNGGRLKINPLTFWSGLDVWNYAEQYRLPINKLHHQGYPSIGCAPCTRAIQADEHPRAGRWWWESPAHKECGLHRR